MRRGHRPVPGEPAPVPQHVDRGQPAARRLRQQPRRSSRSGSAATYERFEWIGERRSELAGRLSGGQQQIVAIARALMSSPKVVLLDEPSSGLSPVAIEEIRALLEHVAASGTAILLVEQNVKLVQSLCQRAWVLAHGTVKDAGPVAELLEGATRRRRLPRRARPPRGRRPQPTDDHAPPRYEEVPT